MAGLDDPPAGWTVWSADADGRGVLVYRPDVFDGEEFPAPCLPTLYLTHGPRERRRPGRSRPDSDAAWHVTLYLEPEVTVPGGGTFPTREEAVEAALDLARQFSAGEVDVREVYQVPREAYLDKLEALTGQSSE